MSGPDDIISRNLPIDGTGVDGLDGAYGADGALPDGPGGTFSGFELEGLPSAEVAPIETLDPNALTPTTAEATAAAVWQKIGA